MRWFKIFSTLLALTVLALPSASAAPMGLGPDARQDIEEWSGRLGLNIKEVRLTPEHAELDLGACTIYLAHEAGTRCSGLFMDAGGARACLSSMTECLPWGEFQAALSKAGALYPSWQELKSMPKGAGGTPDEGVTTLPKGFEAAIEAIEEALLWLKPQRANRLMNELIERGGMTLAQELSVIPGASRVGLGAQALARLGSGVWLDADKRLTMIVRTGLMMGEAAAVAVAEAVLDESDACTAVPIGHAFMRMGHAESAAALGRVLRARDVKCFEAYALEIRAAYQAGQRQAVANAFYEARARFSKEPKLLDLQLIALRATGQWRAAKYVLDQKLSKKRVEPADLALMARVLSQEPLKGEALIALKAQLDVSPGDPMASFLLGTLLHLDKQYKASSALLVSAAKGGPGKVGYLHTLQGLNALALGDMSAARASVDEAIALTPRDPEAHWAFAEIVRDSEPLVAARSLDIALALLPYRAVEAVRMSRQRSALDKCDGKSRCKGPWRYTAKGDAP